MKVFGPEMKRRPTDKIPEPAISAGFGVIQVSEELEPLHTAIVQALRDDEGEFWLKNTDGNPSTSAHYIPVGRGRVYSNYEEAQQASQAETSDATDLWDVCI